MKVFHIISHFDLGGAERVAINIAKSKSPEFQYYLFEVVKGNSLFTTELKKELEKNGIKYYSSPFKNKKTAICLFWVWFIGKYLSIKPDIIHIHTEVPDLAVWIFRKIAWFLFWIKPKYIRTIHNTELWNEWKSIGYIVERFYYTHNCNIAISISTQSKYQDTYGGKLPPIIYNGLEIKEQKVFPNLKKDKINILFAGRLEYQKGIDELIAVITSLQKDKRFFFHIIGDGSMKEKLNSAIQGLNNVSVYPKVYGLSDYLGSFDYLFMPSNFEGLALMSIEASLSHTPTIINSCSGLSDTLPEDWELAVKNNSVTDFLKIFNNLPHYDYLYLCEKAYQFAITHFSIEKMQKEYENVYRQQK